MSIEEPLKYFKTDVFDSLYTDRLRQDAALDQDLFDTQIGKDRSIYLSAFTLSKPGVVAALECLLTRIEDWRREDHQPTFLDLGCSIGWINAIASSHGWRSIGIEIDDGVRQAAVDLCSKLVISKFIPCDNPPTIIHGDFYPSDFQVEIPNELVGPDRYREMLKRGSVISPATSINYAENGIDLSKVDIFYHYQVEPSARIMRFFQKYASNGAILFMVAGMGDWRPHETPEGVIRLKLPAETFSSLGVEVYQNNVTTSDTRP